jgi:thioredoxin reductase (NADPH)
MENIIPTVKNINTEILIIGAGPAGLTAGLYASRAGRKTLILKGRADSRLSIGYTIENYPGFLSLNSQELLTKFQEHAQHFGAEIVTGDALNFSLTTAPKQVTTRDALIEAKAVILATGRSLSKAQMIPGEEKLIGMGVSYCATCDGPLFRGQKVVAVGHTDEAAEDVLALNQMGCEVLWVSGGKEWQVSEDLMKEVRAKGIPLTKAKIQEISGDQRIDKVALEKEGKKEEQDAAALFIFRNIPTAPLYQKAGIALDYKQCIKVDRFQETNLKGVFAAGDVTCGGLQIVSAAGEGCVAALSALNYLRKLE